MKGGVYVGVCMGVCVCGCEGGCVCGCVCGVCVYVGGYGCVGQCNLFTWLLKLKDVSCYKLYIAKQTLFVL